MTRTRGRTVYRVSAGIAAGLAVALVAGCQGGLAPPGVGAGRVVDSRAATDIPAEEEVVNVRLNVLSRGRPDVAVQPRNPFRFDRRAQTEQPVAPPSPRSLPSAAEALRRAQMAARVSLRLIGFVESNESAQRIAVLTDGDHVYHGQTGDIIEGRYRILRMSAMSVAIESIADGRRDVLELAQSR
jgi:hypothetical protein